MKKKYGICKKINSWSAVKGKYTKRVVNKNTRRIGKAETKAEAKEK